MASKSFDFQEVKQRTAEFSKNWQKKLNYLSQSVSRSGMEGASHWVKSHHQIDDLKEALNDLVSASEDPDFVLTQVDTTLSSFVLPEEDQGQAEWYKTADHLINQFYKKLTEQQEFDIKLLQNALKELKFISQADEFHQRYQLEPIQQKVTTVYQQLMQAITDQQSIQKDNQAKAQQEEQLQLTQAEAAKAAAEAKIVMMENVKIKEKRLAIIEEKKRRVAEKELLVEQQRQDIENAERNAKQAELDRQAKLQDAYVDLQLEEKINNWQPQELVALLQQKAQQAALSPELQNKIEELVVELGAAD